MPTSHRDFLMYSTSLPSHWWILSPLQDWLNFSFCSNSFQSPADDKPAHYDSPKIPSEGPTFYASSLLPSWGPTKRLPLLLLALCTSVSLRVSWELPLGLVDPSIPPVCLIYPTDGQNWVHCNKDLFKKQAVLGAHTLLTLSLLGLCIKYGKEKK